VVAQATKEEVLELTPILQVTSDQASISIALLQIHQQLNLQIHLQAPEALRTTLSDEMDQFSRSLQTTGIGGSVGASTLFFSHVRNVRCLAWQNGRRVQWGALFDDSRQQPVIWRQDGIEWNIQMTKGGQMIREREGKVNSSRALNPLADADLRELALPDGFEGDVELQLTVGGVRTTTRLTIK
jgi:hypothetical protein